MWATSNDSVRRHGLSIRRDGAFGGLDTPLTVLCPRARLAPRWLLDRSIERCRRRWVMSKESETGRVEVAGQGWVADWSRCQTERRA